MNRNFTIDTLRTIAALLVILLHVSAEYVMAGKNSLTFDTSFWVANIIDSFSRICVPLFVLISGMFLIGRNESFKQSYQKRATRILIPLISWSLIYLFYRLSSNLISHKPLGIDSLIESLFLGQPYYHMWYLFMIIGLYFITPVINRSIPLLSRNTLWKVAVLLLIFGMLNSSYNRFFDNKFSFIFWFVNFLGYFLMGFLIKDYTKNFSIVTLSSLYIFSSLLIAILSQYTIKYHDSLYFYGYLTPLVIIGSLSVYKIFHQINIAENFFSKISHLTLGIYLIHAGILDVLRAGLKVLEINSFNNPIIGIPVKFSITFLVSVVAAWTINKIKYLNKII